MIQESRVLAEVDRTMAMPSLTDSDLATVATVARREKWVDLGSPPEGHAPRTVTEAGAVARFSAAAAHRGRRSKDRKRNTRIAVVVIVAIVLGACWFVSPERTALALLAAGFISLVALQSGRRRRDRRARGSAL